MILKPGDLVEYKRFEKSSNVGIVIEVKDLSEKSLFTGKYEQFTVAYVMWSSNNRISTHVARALRKI